MNEKDKMLEEDIKRYAIATGLIAVKGVLTIPALVGATGYTAAVALHNRENMTMKNVTSNFAKAMSVMLLNSQTSDYSTFKRFTAKKMKGIELAVPVVGPVSLNPMIRRAICNVQQARVSSNLMLFFETYFAEKGDYYTSREALRKHVKDHFFISEAVGNISNQQIRDVSTLVKNSENKVKRLEQQRNRAQQEHSRLENEHNRARNDLERIQQDLTQAREEYDVAVDPNSSMTQRDVDRLTARINGLVERSDRQSRIVSRTGILANDALTALNNIITTLDNANDELTTNRNTLSSLESQFREQERFEQQNRQQAQDKERQRRELDRQFDRRQSAMRQTQQDEERAADRERQERERELERDAQARRDTKIGLTQQDTSEFEGRGGDFGKKPWQNPHTFLEVQFKPAYLDSDIKSGVTSSQIDIFKLPIRASYFPVPDEELYEVVGRGISINRPLLRFKAFLKGYIGVTEWLHKKDFYSFQQNLTQIAGRNWLSFVRDHKINASLVLTKEIVEQLKEKLGVDVYNLKNMEKIIKEVGVLDFYIIDEPNKIVEVFNYTGRGRLGNGFDAFPLSQIYKDAKEVLENSRIVIQQG